MNVCKVFNKFVNHVMASGKAKCLNMSAFLRFLSVWSGRICLILFFASLLALTYVVCFLIIPFEWRTYENVPWLAFRILIGAYVYYNVLFHYYKTRTLETVKNPGTPRDEYCIACKNWKSGDTRHCRGCGKCIYRFDHHCPHMGQCIGAHNQASFFLFLVYLLVGTALFFLFGPNFWTDWLETELYFLNMPENECWRPYCFNQYIRMLSTADFEENAVIKFSVLLSASIHCFLWIFVICQSYFICLGTTVALLSPKKSLAKLLIPLNWTIIKKRWRKHFNCQEEESLWIVFLIPRTRRLIVFENRPQII